MQFIIDSFSIKFHYETGWENLSVLILRYLLAFQFSSVSQTCQTLRPHDLRHTRLPCPSSTTRACSNSCPLSQWCHPTISSSVIPFSSCFQSFPSSGSFQMSKLLASGGQSIGVSASTSAFPKNTQDWSPLGWTGWISLQSKGLSRVFSNTTVQKHQSTAGHTHWGNQKGKRHVYPNVHRSTVYNSQDMEAT